MFNSEPPAVVPLKKGLCCLLITDAKTGDVLLAWNRQKNESVFSISKSYFLLKYQEVRYAGMHLILDKNFCSLSFL